MDGVQLGGGVRGVGDPVSHRAGARAGLGEGAQRVEVEGQRGGGASLGGGAEPAGGLCALEPGVQRHGARSVSTPASAWARSSADETASPVAPVGSRRTRIECPPPCRSSSAWAFTPSGEGWAMSVRKSQGRSTSRAPQSMGRGQLRLRRTGLQRDPVGGDGGQGVERGPFERLFRQPRPVARSAFGQGSSRAVILQRFRPRGWRGQEPHPPHISAHPRGSGNPDLSGATRSSRLPAAKTWVPASAGMSGSVDVFKAELGHAWKHERWPCPRSCATDCDCR